MAVTISTSLESKYQRNLVRGDGWNDRRDWIARYQSWEMDYRREHNEKPLGVPFPLELFPKTAHFVKGNKLYDYNGIDDGGIAVSGRLKQEIEDIEPGVHQFVPVEIFHKDGTPYGERFYFFTICTCIDAISPDLGGVKKSMLLYKPEKYPDKYIWTILPGNNSSRYDKLAVRKDKIQGRACWRDRRYITGYFFSDEIFQRMREKKLEGFRICHYWREI